jgi:hypothetical protein
LREDVVNVATPLPLTFGALSVDEPSLNVTTSEVGIEPLPVTVAVNVTLVPREAGLLLLVSVVVEVAWPTGRDTVPADGASGTPPVPV